MGHQNKKKGRSWKLLYWNVRGINSSSKWNAIRSKINESSCDTLCIQETKREFFDSAYIKKICVPGPLILLNMSHRVELREASYPFGKVANLLATWYSKTDML
jgi:hypothetical protein